MAKSLKSLLSKINLVDVAVVLVLIAVLMCLMKKMNVVEAFNCIVSEKARIARDTAIGDMANICADLPNQGRECTNPMTWDGCEDIIDPVTGRNMCGINMCEESDEKVPQFDERLPSQIVPESRRGARPGTPEGESIQPAGTQNIEPNCIINMESWAVSGFAEDTSADFWFTSLSHACNSTHSSECGTKHNLGVDGDPSQSVRQCCIEDPNRPGQCRD